jgi:hypothetical protein
LGARTSEEQKERGAICKKTGKFFFPIALGGAGAEDPLRIVTEVVEEIFPLRQILFMLQLL